MYTVSCQLPAYNLSPCCHIPDPGGSSRFSEILLFCYTGNRDLPMHGQALYTCASWQSKGCRAGDSSHALVFSQSIPL